MVKTSSTHPLRIDVVRPPGAPGAIGLTLCPGRKGSSLEGGSWDRDLPADLEVVRAWKPAIVLGLMQDFEYAALGIPNFKRDVISADLPWVFPEIVDQGAPDVIFERAWDSLGARVRADLASGKNVLVHCRAGLGRTGLVAAMLLVEFGMDPEAAMVAVRAARANTIETATQEAYVRACRTLSPPTPF